MHYWKPRAQRETRSGCPVQKIYPANKLGRSLLIVGVIIIFLFAPFWVWVIGLGVALILLGISILHSD